MLVLNFFFDVFLRLLCENLKALLSISLLSLAQKLNEIFWAIKNELFSKP